MSKPVSKEINGKTYYARKFNLAGVNEMSNTTIKMQLGDAGLSMEDVKKLAKESEDEGVELTDIQIAALAQSRVKISMAGMMVHSNAIRSLRLRHSLCNADGILIYKSVAHLEDVIDPDIVGELVALVNEANAPKPVSIELEEAEKN